MIFEVRTPGDRLLGHLTTPDYILYAGNHVRLPVVLNGRLQIIDLLLTYFTDACGREYRILQAEDSDLPLLKLNEYFKEAP